MKRIVLSLFSLILLFFQGCGDYEVIAKTMCFTSNFDGETKIDYLKGISMFKKGSGVDPLDFRVFRLHSSVTTFEEYVYFDFPIEIEWTLTDKSGKYDKIESRSKTFDSIEGIDSDRISTEFTIWVYFDKQGDAHLKFLEGRKKNPELGFDVNSPENPVEKISHNKASERNAVHAPRAQHPST
jgi:hypothetical protein